LTCSYDGREFVRVGYYVNNEYTDEALIAEPPAKAVVEKVRRSILAEKPRVTRFAIKWDSEASAPAEFPPEQPDADNQEDDEAAYGAEELEEDEVEVEGEPEVKEGEDAEMAEANPVEQPKEEDEVSDAGSEDIEAESSASEDEDEEEEEGEGEAEGEAADEMETDNAAPAGATEKPQPAQQQGDVMVH
jgi:histone chaperone ASF1